jgi:hypothetical protein
METPKVPVPATAPQSVVATAEKKIKQEAQSIVEKVSGVAEKVTSAVKGDPKPTVAEAYVMSKGYPLAEAKNIVRQYGESYILEQKAKESGREQLSTDPPPPGQRSVRVYNYSTGKRLDLDRMIDSGATLDIWVKP